MPSSTFTPVWDALSPDLRRRLVERPARRLTPEDVDELARAGGRTVHALFLDARPGQPREWATSWQFRRFVELLHDVGTGPRTSGGRLAGGRLPGGRQPTTPR